MPPTDGMFSDRDFIKEDSCLSAASMGNALSMQLYLLSVLRLIIKTLLVDFFVGGGFSKQKVSL